eukprot:CAMPEP_0177776136 /NCGR_PEP_ID=MMETSP0491_2-20121128/14534_1 /TAXON_ID=63592 /ORGANISM="Tetraselmis chuii, Strain PLY429" /LENGTH=63 /DNA_ID=CAMNT_0019294871 /DNA_START=27 /DNA_END=218 /DNA_ORIENTATION=-
MGLLAFAIRRCADVIIPGSGAILDMFDVLDSIEALKDGYDAQEILDAKKCRRRRSRKSQGAVR